MAIATDALSSQFGIAIISAPNALPLLGERKAVLFLLKRAFEPLSTTIDGSFRVDSPINRAKSFLASFTLRLISSSLLFINLRFMCDVFIFIILRLEGLPLEPTLGLTDPLLSPQPPSLFLLFLQPYLCH